MVRDVRWFARLLARVSRDIVTSPVRWRLRQWILLLAIAATTAVAFIAGRWARRRALGDAALVLGVAGVWCFIFTKTGQFVLAERRPTEGGTMKLLALGGHGVSGHAAAASLLFSPVRDLLFSPVRDLLARGATPGVRRMVTAGLLARAIVVAWSRVWLGMHFVWNVMLGLAIGFFTGLVAARASRA